MIFIDWKKIKTNADRLIKYDKEIESRKKTSLREYSDLGEQVLVLAERLKRKDATGKFYKSSIQNTLYFNKDEIFVILKKTKNK